MRRDNEELADVVVGTIAGVIATAAMTWSAAYMFRRLPEEERYPLPPREITESVMTPAAPQSSTLAWSVIAHSLFGAVCGGLSRLFPVASRWASSNIGYAFAIWTSSYFGWVPGFHILRPANFHPPRRNLLMIGAHAVWGLSLWASSKLLSYSLEPLRAGPIRDAYRIEDQQSRRRSAAALP